MSENRPPNPASLHDEPVAVGTRVHLTTTGAGSGLIVEDFGPLPELTEQHFEPATRPRRYAIALNDGTLLFLDPHEFDTTTDE